MSANWIEHVLVPGVRALSTLRGVVPDDYRQDPARQALAAALGPSVTPVWMHQVHGSACMDLDSDDPSTLATADAAVARTPGRAAAVLTADCVPVFLAAQDGSVVALAHAGWRGLAAGVIEATVGRMRVAPASLVAGFGPAIGTAAFEVGPEVRDAFVRHRADAALAFRPGRADRWHANLYDLAQQALMRIGVSPPRAPRWCTFEEARFHSWRRDGQLAGRMAHLIWRLPGARCVAAE
ncbi:MAG: peptidoglycan editing factor PgeF [Xanthomonadales bacterium]|jgi:hypothetical protein|nr:peptidoglycan editing factor PgeF [Xanthomonadales bacterium]